MGVIRIWGFTGTRPQSPEGLLARSPSPTAGLSPTWRAWQGRKRGLPYPRFCHLERARRNPLCEGTLRHTQGHLGGGERREMLEVAGVGAAVPHTFKNMPACLPVLSPEARLPPGPGGSSPRGSVRLEALSLRAGPDGLDGSS